jgi:hypothetical protein
MFSARLAKFSNLIDTLPTAFVELPAPSRGLNIIQAQGLVDHAALRLEGHDFEVAERLLDDFVARLRALTDLELIRQQIADGDEQSLLPIGGVEGAKTLLELVEKICPTGSIFEINSIDGITATAP